MKGLILFASREFNDSTVNPATITLVLGTASIGMDALGLYLEASKFATVFNINDALECASLVLDKFNDSTVKFTVKLVGLEASKAATASGDPNDATESCGVVETKPEICLGLVEHRE